MLWKMEMRDICNFISLKKNYIYILIKIFFIYTIEKYMHAWF